MESSTVTTYHHDKPEKSSIPYMARKMNGFLYPLNITLSQPERQKRLLPYTNFYFSLHQSHIPVKQTDHYHSERINARNQVPHILNKTPQTQQRPINTSNKNTITTGQIHKIYSNDYLSSTFPNNIPIYSSAIDRIPHQENLQNYMYNVETIKKSFNNLNNEQQVENEQSKSSFRNIKGTTKDMEQSSIIMHKHSDLKTGISGVKTPLIIIHLKPIDPPRPPFYENSMKYLLAPEFAPEQTENLHQYGEVFPTTHLNKNYLRSDIIPKDGNYKHQASPKYGVNYNLENEQTGHESNQYDQLTTKDSRELGKILEYLQATNSLPKSITLNNIDNSIKTLVRILSHLKKQQKFTKPIVVQDNTEEYIGFVEDKSHQSANHNEELDKFDENNYVDTPEGGTPGKPGVDYPAFYSIPQTTFSCKTQRYKGFFGDPDTNCQVWHYCDLNGGKASFLCPNGTIFSQIALTCDWWYNVKCSSTAQQYVLNERLYKYILPLTPKFPEDYTGPLVDKYLALKFTEMEEKMKKAKKGKENVIEEGILDKTEEGNIEMSSRTTDILYPKETLVTIENNRKR